MTLISEHRVNSLPSSPELGGRYFVLQNGAFFQYIVNNNGVAIPQGVPAHTHSISDIIGLQQALDDKIDLDEKGEPNGVAELGPDGIVPADQLPPYEVPNLQQVTDEGAITTNSLNIGTNLHLLDVAIFRATTSGQLVISSGNSTGNSKALYLRPGGDVASTVQLMLDYASGVATYTGKSINYAADYSANWTDHSLITKKFLVDNISGLAGANLSYDPVANKINLNGFIEGQPANGNQAALISKQMAGVTNSGAITLTRATADGNSTLQAFEIDTLGQMILTDNQHSKGVVYGGDYSANWTDNSLITKKFVTDSIAAIPIPTLHQVTTAGNTTTNAITVGSSTSTITTTSPSYAIKHDATGKTAIITQGSGTGTPNAIFVDLANEVGGWAMQANNASNVLRLLGGSGKVALFVSGRTRGEAAINDNEYVTKAQVDTLTGAYIPLTQKASPLGVATLGSDGKVVLTQLPDFLFGNVRFGGTYNGQTISATSNFTELNGGPLPAAADYEGVYFISTATYDYNGTEYKQGDWIISTGIEWTIVRNSDAVTTVFGRSGNILANNGDYNTAQVTEDPSALYFTQTRARQAISVFGDLTYDSSTGVISYVTPDLSGYALNTRTITAGNGLTGGGNLTANRTIALGTPGTLTPTSINEVTATSHTHAITGLVSTNNEGGSPVGNYTGLDANTIGYTNMIYGGGWTNTPPGVNTGYLQTIRHPNSTASGSSAQLFWVQNSANNSFYWRTQTAGTYNPWRQVADRDWVTSQIPAAQTLTFNSTYGTNLGQLSISGGNSVGINALRAMPRQTHDENLATSAFVAYTNSAGSTGYPAATGSGIIINRYSTATSNSGFNLWTSTENNDELRLAFINGNNVYSSWYTVATREWANGTLLQLADTVQNVSGTKYFTNFYIGNSSTQNVSYGISALGALGSYGDLVESDLVSDSKFSKSRTDYYTFAQANTVSFPLLQAKATAQGSAAFSYARLETKKVWTNGAGVQFAYPYGTTESVLDKIYFRASTAASSGVWTPWYTLATREWVTTQIPTTFYSTSPTVGGALVSSQNNTDNITVSGAFYSTTGGAGVRPSGAGNGYVVTNYIAANNGYFFQEYQSASGGDAWWYRSKVNGSILQWRQVASREWANENLVTLATNQTITGDKIFTGKFEVNSPATDNGSALPVTAFIRQSPPTALISGAFQIGIEDVNNGQRSGIVFGDGNSRNELGVFTEAIDGSNRIVSDFIFASDVGAGLVWNDTANKIELAETFAVMQEKSVPVVLSNDKAFKVRSISNPDTSYQEGFVDFSINTGVPYTGGVYSVAFGLNNKVTGNFSMIFGRDNICSGGGSIAGGSTSTASGTYSFAVGNAVQATASYTFAVGNTNLAQGTASAAFGTGNTASGINTFVAGSGNETSGALSLTTGFNNINKGYAGVVIGRLNDPIVAANEGNWVNGSPVFIVGNGTTTAARSNAYVLYNDGRSVQQSDFEITTASKGVILKSPDGTRYRITVANGGAVTATAI